MLNLQKKIFKKFAKDKNYQKVIDHYHYSGKYRGRAHSICNSKFDVPNAISVVFHIRSNYDYYFIIKEFPDEFERQFECLGENKEKCKNFCAPIKK